MSDQQTNNSTDAPSSSTVNSTMYHCTVCGPNQVMLQECSAVYRTSTICIGKSMRSKQDDSFAMCLITLICVMLEAIENRLQQNDNYWLLVTDKSIGQKKHFSMSEEVIQAGNYYSDSTVHYIAIMSIVVMGLIGFTLLKHCRLRRTKPFMAHTVYVTGKSLPCHRNRVTKAPVAIAYTPLTSINTRTTAHLFRHPITHLSLDRQELTPYYSYARACRTSIDKTQNTYRLPKSIKRAWKRSSSTAPTITTSINNPVIYNLTSSNKNGAEENSFISSKAAESDQTSTLSLNNSDQKIEHFETSGQEEFEPTRHLLVDWSGKDNSSASESVSTPGLTVWNYLMYPRMNE